MDDARRPPAGDDGTEPAPASSPDRSGDREVVAAVDGGGRGEVAGTLAPDAPVEPGRLDPRNALFVAVGGYLGVLAVAAFVNPVGGLGTRTLLALTAAYAAVVAVLYLALARSNPDT